MTNKITVIKEVASAKLTTIYEAGDASQVLAMMGNAESPKDAAPLIAAIERAAAWMDSIVSKNSGYAVAVMESERDALLSALKGWEK